MILITGGSGMIGQALVNYYQKQGIPLRIQVRRRHTVNAAAGAEVQELDFAQASPADFARLVKGCHTVIHTAGLVHQPQAAYSQYELLNVRSTQQLAESAAAAGVETFVFLSTIAVYGSGTLKDVDEKTEAHPETPYAVSKQQSELWLQSAGKFKRTIVVRPSLVFGPGDRGNMIKLIKQIQSGRYFHLYPNAACKSLIHTADLAQVIDLLLQKTTSGFQVYNAANPEPVSVKLLADKIASGLNQAAAIPTLPVSIVSLGARLAESVLKDKAPVKLEQVEKLTNSTTCSVQRLVKQTAFSPSQTLDEALRTEISWAQESHII